MSIEIKSKPPAGQAAAQKPATALKIKINGFLINYFNYLFLVLSLVILASGLFTLVWPKYRQISQVNQETKKNLLIEYETKLNYLVAVRNLKKSYQAISDDDKAKITAMVPASSDSSAIITEIEAIALRNGAILTSVKIEPTSGGNRANLTAEATAEAKEKKEAPAGIINQLPQGVGLIKLEVNLSSVDYSLLKNIIRAFENNLRIFDIAKVNFNDKEDKALLNVYSYYLTR